MLFRLTRKNMASLHAYHSDTIAFLVVFIIIIIAITFILKVSLSNATFTS